MALTTSSNKVIHGGNGVATSFAFTFPILESSHLQVIYTDTAGAETTLSSTLYSVTGIGSLTGGAVTYPLSGSPIALNTTLTIKRVVPLTQTTVLSNQGGYYPEAVEGRLDRVYMALQQIQEEVDRFDLDPPTVQPIEVVETLAALKALSSPSGIALVKCRATLGDRGGGIWAFRSGDQSANVTADTQSGLWAAPATGPTGSSGAWQRIFNGAINSRWFGHHPSATAAVNSTAIQAAKTAATSGRLEIEPGTYEQDIRTTIPSGCQIVGYGAVIKLKSNVSPIPSAIWGTAVAVNNDIAIEGLTFDGNWTNNIEYGAKDGAGNATVGGVSTLVCLVDLYSVTRATVKNCYGRNSWGGAFYATDCVDIDFSGNRVYDCRYSGIVVRDYTAASLTAARRARIVGNYVENCCNGIHVLFGQYDVDVAGNVVVGCSDRSRWPSFAFLGTYPNIYPATGGFTASGGGGYVTAAVSGDGAGIELSGDYTDVAADPVTRVAITANTCAGNIIGIRAEEFSQKVTVTGNTCNANTNDGITFFSARFFTATGNTCSDNGDVGIRVEKTASKDIPSMGTLSGNTIYGNTGYGIGLGGTNNITVSGNTIGGNNVSAAATGGGIALYTVDGTNSTNNNITGNTLVDYTNTENYGIYGDASQTDNLVTANTFTGHNTAATNLSHATNKIAQNKGLVTENGGDDSIPSGSTTKAVTHGLAFTPSAKHIALNFTEQGTNNYGRWWLSAFTSTQFTVNVSADPGASNLDFSWSARPV